MRLDTWTQLPDDERLFSYEKYLLWNNYRLKYKPQETKAIDGYYVGIGYRNFTYDTLSNALIFPSVLLNLSHDDRSTSIYSTCLKNIEVKFCGRLIYKHQLNRYLYCLNNSLKYIDPTGHLIVEMLAIEVALGVCLAVKMNKIYNSLDPGFGYCFNFGMGLGLFLYKDYEGRRRIYFGPIGGGGT